MGGLREGFAQATFQNTYGTSGSETGNSVFPASDGGNLIVGTTGTNILFLKTDYLGNILIQKVFTGTGNDFGNSVIETSDGGYAILCRTNSYGAGHDDAMIIKLDASGTLQWAKTYGLWNYEQPRILRVTNTGGFLLAGMINSAGAGGTDIMLLKLDASGNILRQKAYGGVDGELPYQVDFTIDGGLAIVGFRHDYITQREVFLMKIDSMGLVQWMKVYRDGNWNIGQGIDETVKFTSMHPGGIEEFFISGYTTSYGAGAEDIFVFKTDNTGALLWSKTYGGSGTDVSRGVVIQGNTLLVPGFTTSFGKGGGDIYLLMLDFDGNLLGSRTYGGAASDMAITEATDNLLQFTDDGGMVMLSSTQSFGAGGSDVYLVKAAVNGNSGCNETNTTTTQVGNAPFNVVSITPTVTNLGLIVGNPVIPVNSILLLQGVLCRELPTTQLSAGDCGAADIELNQILKADSIPGVDAYIFYISSDSLHFYDTLFSNDRYFRLSEINGILQNRTYSVKIKVAVGSDTSDFGSECFIRTAIIPFCGFGDVFRHWQATNPNFEQWFDSVNMAIKNYIDSMGIHTPPYTLPIIFHIIYPDNLAYGSGAYLSYEQIQSQIAALNAAFSGDYSGYNQQSNAACSGTGQITFCLAQNPPAGVNWQTDIQGNVLAGIIYHPLPAGDEVHDMIINFEENLLPGYDPNYLNIFTVSDICKNDGFGQETGCGGLQGYASGPGQLVNGIIDGVVMRSDVIGDNSVAGNNFSLSGQFDQGKILVHEVGHYLGLLHTFHPNDVAPNPNSACEGTTDPTGADPCDLNGDGVCDTPPANGYQYNCSSPAPNTCIEDITLNVCCGNCPVPPDPCQNPLAYGTDRPDMVENFMAYSDDECMRAFTCGQIQRIWGTIDLLRPEFNTQDPVNNNPAYTGLTGANGCAVCTLAANINYLPPFPCPGTQINFYTPSGPNFCATSWLWDFGDGFQSNLQNPIHTFITAGNYTVTLIASDGGIHPDVVEAVQVVVVFPTAQITGQSAANACLSSIQTITITFTGNPPFTATLTDDNPNTNNQQIVTDDNPATVNVNIPAVAGVINYSLVTGSFSDGIGCVGNVFGLAAFDIQCCGGNLIVNGDFGSGVLQPFGTQQITFVQNCDPSQPIYNSTYTIGGIPENCNGLWDNTPAPISPSGPPYFICDADNSPTVNMLSQQVAVTPGTCYTLSFWANNLVDPAFNFTNPIIGVNINGIQELVTGEIFKTPNQWVLFSIDWCAPVGTSSANIEFFSLNDDANGGSDIGLDDISFQQSIITNLVVASTNACTNNEGGTATVTVTGGSVPFTYEWSTGTSATSTSASHTATGLSAGIYTVTVTDASGCPQSTQVTVNLSLATLLVNVTPTNVSCYGGSDGTITLDVTEISTGLTCTNCTYTWAQPPLPPFPQNINTDKDQTDLPPGTYSVTVTDAGGNCIAIPLAPGIQITEPAEIIISISTTGANCPNSDGTATANVIGGVGAYTYSWSNGQSGTNAQTATNLAGETTYTVTVTDANTCSKTKDALIDGQIDAAISHFTYPVPGACLATAALFLQAVPVTGTSPYTYVWSTGKTSESIEVFLQGTYAVTITDINNCSGSESRDIQTFSLMDGGITAVSYCNSATLTAQAGSVYAWAPGGASSQSITATSSGVYSVTITNPVNCGTFTGDITSSTYVDVVPCTTTVCDLQVEITGVQIPMSAPVPCAFNPGCSCYKFSYFVTIKNFGDAANDVSLTVTLPSELEYIPNSSTTVIGGNTVNYEPTPSGSNLVWGPFAVSQNLTEGQIINFKAEIPEPGACLASPVPLGLNVNAVITTDNSTCGTNCCNDNDNTSLVYTGNPLDPNNKIISYPAGTGSCRAIRPDDTITYIINFQNIGTAPANNVVLFDTLDNLYLDIQSLKILHASHPATLYIYNGNIMRWDFTGINLPYISINPEGSIGFVKFSIQPVTGIQPLIVIENRAAIIFDYNDPVITNTVFNTIQGHSVSITASGAAEFCEGNSVTLTAGVANSYLWSTGETTQIIAVTQNGSFSVIDTSGCYAPSDTITTTVYENPAVDLISCQTVYYGYSPLECATVVAGVTGGSPPYAYYWSNGVTTSSVTLCPSSTTVFTVIISDANGCTATDVVTVEVVDVRCGNNLDKVSLCHLPPGNPQNAQQLCIDASAVPAHLTNHGDELGTCGSTDPCASAKTSGANNADALNEEVANRSAEQKILFVAFPNPFHKITTIVFSLPQNEIAELSVYNIIGEKVSELFNGAVIRDEYYRIEFTMNDLQEGIYYCTLKSNGFTRAIKLFVLNR